jgi:hypothetical protein
MYLIEHIVIYIAFLFFGHMNKNYTGGNHMDNSSIHIHETVIRDIVSAISDISAETELKGMFSDVSFKSIARGSSNLTLVFPVMATENTPIEPARMVCKAIERKAVAMLQMLFSAICISDKKNAMEHIKQFHNNIDMGDDLSIDEFIGIVDKMATEESSGIDIVNKKLYDMVMEDLKNNTSYCLDENVNPRSINCYTVDTSRADGLYVEADQDATTELKNAIAVAKDQVIATDIKKANELVPSLMVVKFISSQNGVPIPTTAVIGVKAKLQYVSATDMINRLVIKNKDKNGLFNFLKATTREISFWKDFVFAVDRAKLDAISTSGRGSSSKIWKLLERRAIKSKIKRFTGMVNDASAITTLVISKEEAEALKKDNNIDVKRPNVIGPIMDAYNLMGFVIVDQVLEKVDFLFDDGSNEYETVSFTHLEREESGNYKKVINLLAKSR